MNGKLLFFATKDDILSIMKTFCELLPFEIKYFETGNMSTSSPATFTSIEELPHIGIYYSKSHCSENYCIMKRDLPVVTEKIDSECHGIFYCVYDSMNDTCMSFSPGGLSPDSNFLMHGQFAIMKKNEISNTLIKTAAKALRMHCKQIKGWYIGKEAAKLKEKVRYITIDINELQEYDFNTTF